MSSKKQTETADEELIITWAAEVILTGNMEEAVTGSKAEVVVTKKVDDAPAQKMMLLLLLPEKWRTYYVRHVPSCQSWDSSSSWVQRG